MNWPDDEPLRLVFRLDRPRLGGFKPKEPRPDEFDVLRLEAEVFELLGLKLEFLAGICESFGGIFSEGGGT